MAGKNSRRRRPIVDTRNRKRKRIVHKFDEDAYIDYKDVSLLRKFMSDRGKIRGRRVTGLSPQRQSQVATAIRNAREMALLPYTSTRPER
jgi:small subunit ribosomal protein S18